MATSLH